MIFNAMNSGAARAYIHWPRHQFGTLFSLFFAVFGLFLLPGCSALPDKPVRASLYDFGPGNLTLQPATRQAPLPALAIDDVNTSGGALDNLAVLYRLNYQNAQELHPYSLARWSMPPAQLVRQRLREQLGQRRSIFDARGGLALNRSQATVLPLLLRLDLEEFSHVFTTPDASVGLIRLRATLIEQATSGEKLIAQRTMVVQRPALSADAQGGVKALTAATDAAIEEIDVWLQQSTPR
jgi:cholesterol transport system auxiliary component